jgi:hypothetical protein
LDSVFEIEPLAAALPIAMRGWGAKTPKKREEPGINIKAITGGEGGKFSKKILSSCFKISI